MHLSPSAPAAWFPVPMAVILAAFATLPLWVERIGLYQYLGLEILVWSLFALGFNLLLGYTGLPSFGHGAFFGIGAYALGLIQKHAGAGLWVSLSGAVLVTTAAGALVGLFICHRRGIYFALMTIAFSQVFWTVAIRWHAVTGGEDGLLNIRRPPVELGFATLSLKDNVSLYYFALALFAAVLLLLWRLVHSPLGKVLYAIRQNDLRPGFMGYNVWLFKWLSFTVSTAVAGLAGGLFAMAQQSAYPDVMSLHASGFVVMMTLIGGGLVSFWGPVVGAAVFFLARDLLGAFTETWLLWYGLLFLALVLFKPEGIAGMWQGLAGRGGTPAAPAPSLRSLFLRS